jgi:hypothetical protein
MDASPDLAVSATAADDADGPKNTSIDQQVFRYMRSFLEDSPVLRSLIEGVTAEEVLLAGNVVIGVHANSFRTVRGRT